MQSPRTERAYTRAGMEDSFRIFVSIATAIFLEAMPFLALGSLLSAVVEVFVSSERLGRMTPRSLPGRIAVGIGAGVVLPTCECGVVPVVRRLLVKGVPAPTALAFLLASPIVNPVVLASTFVAFRGDGRMVVARAFVAVLVAACVGFLALAARIAAGHGAYPLSDAVEDSVVDYHLEKLGRYRSTPFTRPDAPLARFAFSALTRLTDR